MENMNKKEKEAIWYCSEILADNENDIEHWKIVEKLIDKLLKENKELKEKINKVVLMIDDNYRSEWYDDYETIAGLRDDIYDLLKIKYKGVKD